MAGHVAFLFLVIFFDAILADEGRHSRFEYKLSFKGPHIATKQGAVPFWAHYGSAIPSDEQIRITPSLKDQRGGLWTKTISSTEFWEVEVFFKISGRGRVGGDGLAVWFTETAGLPGPVFGSSDKWKGLGLFFDSFDNDGEQNNPYVMAMVNDGDVNYDHFKDGNKQQLGGCMRDFRNRPYPVRAKIRYYNNVLTVFYHAGMTEKSDDYELCMRAENVKLPKSGYFGVTAATGGLADDHDVLKFLTHSLTPPLTEEQKKKSINEADRKKYEEQYGEFSSKLETQKEEFKKDHPDKKPAEEKYETVYERDVRLMYEAQQEMHKIMRALHGKTGELTQEVNNLHSAVSKQQNSGGSVDYSMRQDIGNIVSLQNDVHRYVKDIASRISNSDVKKLEQIEQNIRTILENVGHLISKNQDNKKSCPSCVSSSYFTFFLCTQIVIIVGYALYKNQQDKVHKKFY
ncbi:protein ERGIC-53 isoform X2 [Hydra vulgaris]|uniref:Protein ERGIC-53 isoform X2 n=1 Tax=Hydra vulgaris TaxID=6087 RepID=A0ABM4CKB9_HYDVU